MNASSHEILIERESAHQDSRIPHVIGSAIRHASLKRFSEAGHLQAFFARPFIESQTPLKILELGCGTGGTAIRLARVGHRVCGIDISRRSIAYAIKGAIDAGVEERVSFRHLDANRLTDIFSEGEFDAVCGIGIFHHLDSIERVLKQIIFLNPKITSFLEALGTNPLFNLIRKMLVGKTHSASEHPLKYSDLFLIQDYFPGVNVLFGGAVTFHHRLRFKLLRQSDDYFSNYGPLWRLGKSVAMVWDRDASRH